MILAGSLISIAINPVMFRLMNPVEKFLRRYPVLWKYFDRHGPTPPPIEESMHGHVVIVGYGRVGRHLAAVLREIAIPYLRNSQLIPNPKSMTVFEAEDRIGLIGDREQIAAVEKLLGAFS